MHTSDCTVYNICVLGIMSLLCKNKCSPDPRMSLTMAIWKCGHNTDTRARRTCRGALQRCLIDRTHYVAVCRY